MATRMRPCYEARVHREHQHQASSDGSKRFQPRGKSKDVARDYVESEMRVV